MQEIVVGNLEKSPRLRIEFDRIALFVDGSHPRKKLGVQVDGIVVRRQSWRLFRPNFLQDGIGIGLARSAERGLRSIEAIDSALAAGAGRAGDLEPIFVRLERFERPSAACRAGTRERGRER